MNTDAVYNVAGEAVKQSEGVRILLVEVQHRDQIVVHCKHKRPNYHHFEKCYNSL